MRTMLHTSITAMVVACPLMLGLAVPAVAAGGVLPPHTAADSLSQPAHQKPKKVTVTRQCDKVKNGTPAGGHSEVKVRATAKAYSKQEAEKLADQEIDRKMPEGYHKRHCRTV
ncbi:hypothetical protein IU510_23090 [Nocardia cyriacigeorgica]|uniref:hypothetical protein n=1 Tax=Nocardia cyriacigeorgica TaxID=135487 RepID=UPI001895CC55|nr:hypothetical protein [Nocardia cyriacigeorgica]MBF6100935.1 hypothetical protein [Nocardia cyriacigeorgica]MBF6160393.1 hypothetical protein [Nocardia cyriacigeorgica]MBF6199478.1 hypothetical protein [Nocardia cyriacigeorgica]MBF6315335.1 hypothetical protein [Nocardia cyriacigeorgica]MBF6343114.1 hypothetical protein [Nocardia cyriacigeorgica]